MSWALSHTNGRRLAVGMVTVFAMIAGIHIVWVFGGVPVVAYPSIPGVLRSAPGPLSTLAAAVVFGAAGAIVLIHGRRLARGWIGALARWGCVGMGIVLIARGVGEFGTIGLFKTVTETPFGIWDTRLYTPLSLALGIGALLLATTSDEAGGRRPAAGTPTAG